MRGKDIKRYKASFADLWLIVSHNGNKKTETAKVDIDDYPAIKRHLDTYYEKIAKRDDQGDTPYNLRNCAYMDEFSKQKIVWGNLCLSSQFAYAPEGSFINAPATMIVPGNKYILAILNSKLGDWYIRQLGVTRNGGYFEYKPMFVDKLPIPILSVEQTNIYVEKIDAIMDESISDDDRRTIEQSIDDMVYDLYSLSKEERSYIENY